VIPASKVAAGDDLWHESRWVLVEATAKAAPRSGLRVTTAGGYHIKLAPEHRMLIDGGRLTAEWASADQLQVGDMMAMESETVGPPLWFVHLGQQTAG
jgi:intein/homing endonuclease